MKYLYFIWKNMTRKKARLIFTVLSIIVAFTMYGVLGALNTYFSGVARFSDNDRLFVISKTQRPLPMSYYEKIKQMDEVHAANYGYLITGYYQKPETMFVQVSMPPELFEATNMGRFVYDKSDFASFAGDRQGAIINQKLADEFGWKTGDRIPLIIPNFVKRDGTNVWEFTVRAIMNYRDVENNRREMFFHYDYFNESQTTLNNMINFLIVIVKNPDRADAVSRAIDSMFQNSAYETRTGTEEAWRRDAFNRAFNIKSAFILIIGAVFLTMLLVTGNSMFQTFRERFHEIAVLKTLGYSGSRIMSLILAESVFILIAGGITGLGIAWILVKTASQNGMSMVGPQQGLADLYLGVEYLLYGMVIIVVFGVIIGAIPAIRARRMTIISALSGRRS